jgi:hypothetical protein
MRKPLTLQAVLENKFGVICNGVDVVCTNIPCPVCRNPLTISLTEDGYEALGAMDDPGPLDWLKWRDVRFSCLLWDNADHDDHCDKRHGRFWDTDENMAKEEALNREAREYLARYFAVGWVPNPRLKLSFMELVYSPLAREIAEAALHPQLPGMTKWRDPAVVRLSRKGLVLA